MKAITRYQWKFEPIDFFEEPLNIQLPGLTLASREGWITADIDANASNQSHYEKEILNDLLKSHFRGHQFVSRAHYTLERPTHSEIDANGRIHSYIEAETGLFSITGKAVDFITRGPDGEVISDTRAERINRKNHLAQLIARSTSDPVADRIVRSYESSITDQQNELIHLYEIRDALQSRFGGEKETRKSLGISKSDWKRLGRLANSEPIFQGRHRGLHNDLREATKQELEDARSIALEMMENYLEHSQGFA